MWQFTANSHTFFFYQLQPNSKEKRKRTTSTKESPKNMKMIYTLPQRSLKWNVSGFCWPMHPVSMKYLRNWSNRVPSWRLWPTSRNRQRFKKLRKLRVEMFYAKRNCCFVLYCILFFDLFISLCKESVCFFYLIDIVREFTADDAALSAFKRRRKNVVRMYWQGEGIWRLAFR